MPKNKTIIILCGITLLALILRIARMLEMNRYDVDCFIYFDMAVNWAKYGAVYAYKVGYDQIPPVFVFVMAMGYKLGFKPDVTALFFGIILGSSIPVCMYYIVKNLFNGFPENGSICGFKLTDLALLAALIASVHPSLVRISVRCLRDTFYVPFVAIALVCAISAIKNRSVSRWSLFACVAVIAALTRYEGTELVIIFAVWQILEIIIKRKTLKQNTRYYFLSTIAVLMIFFSAMFSVNYLMRDTKYRINIFYERVENTVS